MRPTFTIRSLVMLCIAVSLVCAALRVDRVRGQFWQLVYPSYGFCGKCAHPWTKVPHHTTHNCFPLCEKCWASMTPAERLPYYRALMDEWYACGCGQIAADQWPFIREAVLRGE